MISQATGLSFRRLALALLVLAMIPVSLSGDTLWLANGDKLSGKIIKLENEKLLIQTGYSKDPLVVDWALVSSISTENELRIVWDDRKEITSKVTPASAPGQILLQNSQSPLDLNSVIGFEAQAPSEEPRQSWRQDLSIDSALHYDYTGGTGLHAFSWNADVEYLGKRLEYIFRGDQNLNLATENTNSYNQTWGVLTVNRYLGEKFLIFP
jgi:hypothetical protein